MPVIAGAFGSLGQVRLTPFFPTCSLGLGTSFSQPGFAQGTKLAGYPSDDTSSLRASPTEIPNISWKMLTLERAEDVQLDRLDSLTDVHLIICFYP